MLYQEHTVLSSRSPTPLPSAAPSPRGRINLWRCVAWRWDDGSRCVTSRVRTTPAARSALPGSSAAAPFSFPLCSGLGSATPSSWVANSCLVVQGAGGCCQHSTAQGSSCPARRHWMMGLERPPLPDRPLMQRHCTLLLKARLHVVRQVCCSTRVMTTFKRSSNQQPGVLISTRLRMATLQNWSTRSQGLLSHPRAVVEADLLMLPTQQEHHGRLPQQVCPP